MALAMTCPCGKRVWVDEKGIVYWHKATGRAFCSALCSLRWTMEHRLP